jgi:hypothetical protein
MPAKALDFSGRDAAIAELVRARGCAQFSNAPPFLSNVARIRIVARVSNALDAIRRQP